MVRWRFPGSVAAIGLALWASAAIATAPPIVVNSTADIASNDGLCTLREAITAASTNTPSGALPGECAGGSPAPAVDHIDFAIPATDPGCVGTPKVCTIKPATTLPDITGGPVYIDGYTQAGATPNTLAVGDDAVLTIEIDASNGLSPTLRVAGSFSGSISGSGSTIRGLALTHMSGNDLCVSCSFGVDASDVTIIGNFIGTDVTGSSSTSFGTGVYVQTSTNVKVGGTAPADRNVISVQNGDALYISSSNGGTVQGNYINVDKSGTNRLSGGRAITIGGSDGVLVGGGVAGAGNVISGHISALQVFGNDDVVQGNHIGIDATGTAPIGDGYGIVLAGGTGTKIGGTGAGEGNLISGNGQDGILVGAAGTFTVQGNRIGTDASGRLPVPNGLCGINAADFAGNTSATIGGTAAGAGNIIAFNVTNGIGVVGSSNVGWSMLGNSIFGNADLGITLAGRCTDLSSTPTQNDVDDVDTGANNLQNYPVITSVGVSGSQTQVHVFGTLNSTDATAFRIEFFANAACGLLGHGQGKIFIGHVDVVTSGHNASFGSVDLTVPRDRHVITAMATDPAGNTSEFSLCSDQDTIFSDGAEGS